MWIIRLGVVIVGMNRLMNRANAYIRRNLQLFSFYINGQLRMPMERDPGNDIGFRNRRSCRDIPDKTSNRRNSQTATQAPRSNFLKRRPCAVVSLASTYLWRLRLFSLLFS